MKFASRSAAAMRCGGENAFIASLPSPHTTMLPSGASATAWPKSCTNGIDPAPSSVTTTPEPPAPKGASKAPLGR
jgi:hypothetical protein